MKRAKTVVLAVVTSFVALGALAACRGVIGIEDLTVSTDGSADAPSSSVKDAGPSDAPTSSTTDGTVVTGDGSMTGPCTNYDGGGSMACHSCCRDMNRMEQNALDHYASDAGCICGVSTCATECANSICSTTPNMNPPTAQCAGCVDGVYTTMKNPQCGDALMRCQSDSNCKAAAECGATCQ